MSRTYKPFYGSYLQLCDSNRNAGNSCCPICRRACGGIAARMAKPDQWLKFYCGGGWRLSVDDDGNPAWIGHCGQQVFQQLIQFPEEEVHA